MTQPRGVWDYQYPCKVGQQRPRREAFREPAWQRGCESHHNLSFLPVSEEGGVLQLGVRILYVYDALEVFELALIEEPMDRLDCFREARRRYRA